MSVRNSAVWLLRILGSVTAKQCYLATLHFYPKEEKFSKLNFQGKGMICVCVVVVVIVVIVVVVAVVVVVVFHLFMIQSLTMF